MSIIRKVGQLVLENPFLAYLSYARAVLTAPNHLRMGAMSVHRQSTFEEYVTLSREVRLYKCNVGKFTYMGPRCEFNSTTIGRYCSIAHDIKCGPGHHPLEYVSTHPMFYSASLRPAQITLVDEDKFDDLMPVTVGNDVWIGANVVIMNGVTIGDGSVIASGCIVTKDVAPYSIVGGVPGKEIRKRFSDEEIAFLLDFKWWEKDLDWLKENSDLFADSSKFMARYQEVSS